MKILADFKVLDLGSFITAPHAAMLLAELGADVIKVERPRTGDPFRWYNEGLSSPIFQAHNRNKRSLELDFTQPAGLEVLDRLVRESDVVLINVRPGVAEKLGVDAKRLMAINPRLVYCSVTGFGPDGPYAKRPSYDTVGQAMSGLMSRVHRSDDARIPGPSTSDTVTGMTICMGALAALIDRERTGRGRVVETNMLEATLGFAIDPVIHYLVTGEEQEYFRRGSTSQAYVLRCKDGKRLCLHMSTPQKFWDGLATATGRPDLLERYPDRVSRMEHYHAIAIALSEIFLARDRDEWMHLLEKHDVPFAPELTLEEVTQDPQVRHLGVLNEVEHDSIGPVRGVNRPIHFDGDNGSCFRGTPRLGEHSEQILAELGFDAARIARLREQGVC
ncbi:CaiB/BaiF CoA-transferase family protein [Hydrogenophaga sp.]|uniref:CaiB/BaiF CoA transferase family protein n=1 Tax=Hydrogenophaga sp. TaxID=1904254 RepID=UPI002728F7B9|nr:CaiB/BaiF CoA-transferase family protein [Hydrogenophaga sp.]MDO9438240.1 CaiB/BaiF CoA-transferase family protein [Hydrogenophaga sp.]